MKAGNPGVCEVHTSTPNQPNSGTMSASQLRFFTCASPCTAQSTCIIVVALEHSSKLLPLECTGRATMLPLLLNHSRQPALVTVAHCRPLLLCSRLLSQAAAAPSVEKHQV